MAHGPDTEELLRRISKARNRFYEFWKSPHLILLNLDITSLPELPAKIRYLNCFNTLITSLPKLPVGLRLLNCPTTQITSLPELPATLTFLNCSDTQITSLPELPLGLLELYCENTLLILQRQKEESISDYNLRWREWESKKRIQERNRLLKEEIVMEAWHPRKVDRWLRLGAELEDM